MATENLGLEAPTIVDGSTNANLIIGAVEWARRRNAHRLVLVAGKQACLEGWRHIVEVGLRMLHFLARASPDTLALTSSSTADSVGISSGTAVNHCLYAATMTLLNPLLYEVS